MIVRRRGREQPQFGLADKPRRALIFVHEDLPGCCLESPALSSKNTIALLRFGNARVDEVKSKIAINLGNDRPQFDCGIQEFEENLTC